MLQTNARLIVRQVRPARQPIHRVRQVLIHKSVTELARLLCGRLQPARLRGWARASQRNHVSIDRASGKCREESSRRIGSWTDRNGHL